MPKKKLTGWLILFIIAFGPVQLAVTPRALTTIDQSFRRLQADYPRLSTALFVFRVLMITSTAVWAYAAWLIYDRQPGTLRAARRAFALGAVIRIVGSFAIVALAGFSPYTAQAHLMQVVPFAIGTAMICTIWYLYLIQSRKVRDIYAPRSSPEPSAPPQPI